MRSPAFRGSGRPTQLSRGLVGEAQPSQVAFRALSPAGGWEVLPPAGGKANGAVLDSRASVRYGVSSGGSSVVVWVWAGGWVWTWAWVWIRGSWIFFIRVVLSQSLAASDR